MFRRLQLTLGALVAGAALAAAAIASEPPHGLKELTNELIHGGTLEGLPPSGFKWSPDGSRLAFLRRLSPDQPPALHLYDLATKRASPIDLPEDARAEKMEVSYFEWSAAGDSILFLSKGDLFVSRMAPGGTLPLFPTRLTRTEAAEKDPRLSPDGTMAGFVRDHHLFVMDLPSGRERQLTTGSPDGVSNGEVDWVYDEEFGISTGWWWSPDSSRIAYLEFDQRQVPRYPIVDWIPTHPEVEWQRYPKAGDANARVRLGVVPARAAAPAGAPPTRWLDLGSDPDIYIPRVSWTARGEGLAAQRLNRDQTHLEMLLFDPNTGASRRVLGERDPHWINIGDDWRFLTSGGFLWGSERDGHRHLYRYDSGGSLKGRLTQGAWSVTDLGTVHENGENDEKSGWVHFMATEKDPSERHLYRVKLNGQGFERLTREDGWHSTWVAPGGGAFVDSATTASSPAAITVRDRRGDLLDTLEPGMAATLSAYRRGRVEYRSVPAPDGATLPASITLPPDFDPGRKYPVLIYVYGGPHAQVVTKNWGGPRGLWHQMMAARGVIVWSLDNRGSAGRGHAWETPLHRDMGRQELADQLLGVKYLKGLPYVDASRIGIWGWSYGGYMTLYALASAPDVFAAGAAVAPVVDWHDYDTIYTERYMDRPADNREGYIASAPLQKASQIKAPLLLVHGSADDNVHVQNSVQLLDSLVKAGAPVEFMLYPRKNHGITGKEARTHLYERITRFFTQHLMPSGAGPRALSR